MDPVTLASAATAVLAPILTKFGENFAEDAGKKLWDTIAGNFKDRPAAAGAASEFAANADDPLNQEAFTLQLRKALTEDPDFVEEIARLVDQLQASKGGISSVGGGNIATEGSIAAGDIKTGNVSGNIVIGNQNTVSQTSIEEDKKSRRQKRDKD